MILFKVQFDKLTEAYLSCKVNPFSVCRCFIGNLLNGERKWSMIRSFNKAGIGVMRVEDNFTDGILYKMGCENILVQSDGTYSADDIIRLENNFLGFFDNVHVLPYLRVKHRDEDILFKAFESTLDMLREIHIANGEIIDEIPQFKKRQHASSVCK